MIDSKVRNITAFDSTDFKSLGFCFNQDYLKPIISPFELGLVLSPEPLWSTKYVFDFEDIIRSNTSFAMRDASNKSDSTNFLIRYWLDLYADQFLFRCDGDDDDAYRC